MNENRLAITSWSAVSPFGIGRQSFVDGLRAGIGTVKTLEPGRWDGPDERACLVPGFDAREVLGSKGTRSMDRGTALAVTAVGRLVDGDRDGIVGDGGDIAVVLGTTMGSAQSAVDFTRTSLTAEKPFYVDPSKMPNTVINCAAGQCAIWCGLKGPNTTLAGGRAAGLFGLTYARRLLATGRAARVLVGATEEYSTARAWLTARGRSGGPTDTVLGEGACVLLVEPASAVPPERSPLAEVLAVESRVHFRHNIAEVLTACVDAVLRSAAVTSDQVAAVVPSSVPGEGGEQEGAVLAGLFGEAALAEVPLVNLIGDAGAALGPLQIVMALETVRTPGSVVLVSTVDSAGSVSCALLRLAGER
ncbi:hypothetical protein BS329_20485 [Amycolatopsis coloradensis]|uniref:Beta-ketoacyl synthase-like N-terminal domain-containing protein n=1 Tax=Amycolatopsis coloradensis TaxID=76021 RepID=A0A1R0KR07_9PSEU|nr:beta-ketoacyl synthase N-terminal-like domain-containing protein [Amycolatopsis coloradensis]OLZ50120.1 hypothetical protein BS329_20485 [Amycolatopsis coloradensis]